MPSGYITCPCESYEQGPDGICTDAECGHDAHQHNASVGDHESCLAQEGDEPGSYLPFEDDQAECFESCCDRGSTATGSTADWRPAMVGPVPFRASGEPDLLCAGWAARTRTADRASRTTGTSPPSGGAP